LNNRKFGQLFGTRPALIGVIHLPPLPGYPASPGIDPIVTKALHDLEALESGPVQGVLVENEEDRPHRVEAAKETIAAMTRVTRELVSAARTARVGVEILLHDPEASMATAAMSGASFIRTDYFSDPMERPEYGRMRIDPEGLLRYRRSLAADSILLLADIQVKYARMLVERSLAESARIAVESGADAVVVTGSRTGDAPSLADLEEARRGANGVPVLVGSGLTASNAAALLRVADGAIVGSSLKRGDRIDAGKVKGLLEALRR
jgi:membrane complex biogenesis BtpA family protein